MQPLISGGTSRNWSVKKPVILGGSYSYDPNKNYNQQTRYVFVWSCKNDACVKATYDSKGT